MIHYLSLLLILCTSLSVYGEGFGPFTRIPIPHGYAPIRLLNKGDTVQCYENDKVRIANVRIHSVTESYIIKLSNKEQVWVAADQKFYVPSRDRDVWHSYLLDPCYDRDSWRVHFFGLNEEEEDCLEHEKIERGWVRAEDLNKGDLVGWTLRDNKEIRVTGIRYLHHKPLPFYSLEIEETGQFCLIDAVRVHNFPWELQAQVVFSHDGLFDLASYAFASFNVYGVIAIAGITVGAAAKFAWDKAKQKWEDTNFGIKVDSAEKKSEEKCDPAFPHTCTYEDAPYHHNQSKGSAKGGKSKAPKNGLAALRNSVPFGGGSYARIGVSEGEIVELKYSNNCVFHGFVVEWDDVTREMRTKLQDAGLVDKKGRPL